MKNPFKKEKHTGLIILASVATIAAGAAAYLYLTENGSDARKSINHKLKDELKNAFSGILSGKTGISKSSIKKVADHFVK